MKRRRSSVHSPIERTEKDDEVLTPMVQSQPFGTVKMNAKFSQHMPQVHALIHRFFSRPFVVVLGFLCMIALLLHSWNGVVRGHNVEPVESSYYHLLVPASEASAGLCKTIFSAAVLGYPAPRLLNWQRKFDDANMIFGGSHIAKIDGILSFLQQLGPQSDNELVSIIDGYDVWFQLRPEVMISRYHQINHRANKRIKARMGTSAATKQDARQTVVFSAQKKCWPASPDDPACFAVPESELASNVYGPQTDQPIDDEKNPFAKIRQRYLNSGTMMGPVGDVRAIMERAAQKVVEGTKFGSDQGIFADIFGEQEYQREVARSRNMSWPRRIYLKLVKAIFGSTDQDNITQPHPTHHRMEDSEENFEFHLGLDYQGELSQPTVFSENDLAWVKHSEREDIRRKTAIAGSQRSDIFEHLAGDIAASTPPFWVPDLDSELRLPVDKTWDQTPLYANMWTGHTPVAIHHNAHHDGLKIRIQTFWNETWFFPNLRDLLRARASEVRKPSAVLSVQNEDGRRVRQEWWDPIDERGGVRIEVGALPGDWLDWQDICGTEGIADEVFRDDRGGWVNPVVFLPWGDEQATAALLRWKEQYNGTG